MTSFSTNAVRLLPLGLVVLVHALVLFMLVQAESFYPFPALTEAMEVALLPPEPTPPLTSPQPHEHQPRSPSKASPPVPLPWNAAPAETLSPPPPPSPAEATPEPALSLAPPTPPKSEPIETVPEPPRADALRLGNNPPEYPSLSRRLGEQGRVLLSLYVLADGSLGQVVLKQSSSYRRLDEAAIAAVKTWKFIPARQNGEAVAAWYLQPLSFSLREAH